MILTMGIFFGVAIVMLSFIWIELQHKKVYDRLKEFRKKAVDSKTLAELNDVKMALKKYCPKHCWHLDQYDYADEIKKYINDKIEEIENNP